MRRIPETVNHSYLAGFFDGEGSVGLYSRKTSTARYHMRATINQVETPASSIIFEGLVACFGGSIHRIKRQKSNHRQAINWSVYGESALPFLKTIQPLLKIKKRAVDLVIRWQEKYGSQRGLKSTVRALSRRRDAARVMRRLDQLRSKGPTRVSS